MIIKLKRSQFYKHNTNQTGSQRQLKSILRHFQTLRNIPSNQKKGLHEPYYVGNFITLSQVPEDQQTEIIQLGFQRQAEGKISLKKYYESFTEPNSLFQFKGYSIKYESIRTNKLYQQLKE